MISASRVIVSNNTYVYVLDAGSKSWIGVTWAPGTVDVFGVPTAFIGLNILSMAKATTIASTSTAAVHRGHHTRDRRGSSVAHVRNIEFSTARRSRPARRSPAGGA
jgi:hypothetical protein